MPRTKRMPEVNGLSYRAIEWRSETINPESMSVEGIAATETPTTVYDWVRDEMVNEILLMSGLAVRGGMDRVPLLNNHQRYDCRDVIGSADGLRVENNKLVCRVRFSGQASDIFARVQEGHIRALSVGYKVLRSAYIPKGQTQNISGREFVGPASVVTSWELREVSVTPIGADPESNVRTLQGKEETMIISAEQRAKLVTRGMPENLDDEAAVAWAIDNPVKPQTTDESNVSTDTIRSKSAEDIEEKARKAAVEEIRKQQEAEKSYAEEVRSLCELAGMPELSSELIGLRTELPEVRKRLHKERADRQASLPFSITPVGQTRNEKFFGAIGTALSLRALGNCQLNQEQMERYLPTAQRPAGWEQFRHASLYDMARECVEADGYRVRGMPRESVAKIALGFGEHIGVRADAGFHVTGSFANLTRDAINKSLLAGYSEREFTWRMVFRQAESAPDFKNIHRIRLSEAPNLPIWIDGQELEQAALVDEREYYAIEAYGEAIKFSWRLLVNDDMSALSRVPQLMGMAAARTVNAAVWSVVTSSPTMSDGQALFSSATGNRKKANTGTGAITVANLGAARAVMRLQVGVNTKGANASPAILNLEPAFLVVPAALETVAQQVINSTYDPVSNAPPGVYNPFSGGTMKLVVEPLLDASSAVQWYNFASTSQTDTLETSFLQGQETPVTNTYRDDATMSQITQIIQSFGVKAVDWRGCFRSTGS